MFQETPFRVLNFIAILHNCLWFQDGHVRGVDLSDKWLLIESQMSSSPISPLKSEYKDSLLFVLYVVLRKCDNVGNRIEFRREPREKADAEEISEQTGCHIDV